MEKKNYPRDLVAEASGHQKAENPAAMRKNVSKNLLHKTYLSYFVQGNLILDIILIIDDIIVCIVMKICGN